MANTLKFGNGEWYGKEGTILAYNSENNNYKPLPFDFSRASTATRVNKQGLIETVGADQPRVDYKDSTDGAMLLEPSRTNSLLQSNQFDTTWTISASIDLTSGQSGVYGSNDAWLLKRNSTGSRYIQQSLSLSSAQYSYSVYLKAESTNWAYLWSYDGSASVNAYFDLENGVVGQTGGAALDGTNIESVGNGWYRCTLIYTHAPDLIRIYPAYSNGSISTGTDNGIYIQYAQAESGSYATSYIPTQGSAVTRLAESCVQTPPSGIIGQTEGTVLVDFIRKPQANATTGLFGISSSNNADRVIIWNNFTLNNLGLQIKANGSNISGNQSLGTFDNDVNYKIAISYKSGEIKAYINGNSVLNLSNSFTFASDLNTIIVNSYQVGINSELSPFKNLKLYNTALSDSELIALTT